MRGGIFPQLVLLAHVDGWVEWFYVFNFPEQLLGRIRGIEA
jgi:hypothetical protein